MASHPLLLEAIALKKCIQVTYNKTVMKLAPHILYSKHDALFIDAVALEKNGEPPREKKLGAFNLAGLYDIALTQEHFSREDLFDPNELRYEGVTLFAIEN